jgi:carbon-monoxide dehydrogenase medium subunit
MHLPRLAYYQATDRATAIEALQSSASSAVLAGGLSLIPELRSRHKSATLLVDITRIPELAQTRSPADDDPACPVAVGAAVRLAEVLTAIDSWHEHQLLREALGSVGTWLVRTQATAGGILGQANPAGQLAAVCAVLDAEIAISGGYGTRVVKAGEQFAGRGCGPGELITELRFPGLSADEGWSFDMCRRRSFRAIVGGVAARVRLGAGMTCRSGRVAPFTAGHDGTAIAAVAEFLDGRAIDEQAAVAAGRIATDAVATRDDHLATAEYRRHMVGVMVERALLIAAQRAVRIRATGGEIG